VHALDGLVRLQPAGQFGRPSVASRRYFGFESDTVIRYAAPVDTASLVGVFPLGLVFLIALAIAAALPAPIATTGALFAPQASLSEKNFNPQLTVVSVAPTTWFSAAVTWLHFDFDEQLLLQFPSEESFIEPDLS